MKVIFCDLCKREIGDEQDEKFELKIGIFIYPDVCTVCYKKLYDFVQQLIKS